MEINLRGDYIRAIKMPLPAATNYLINLQLIGYSYLKYYI